MELRNVIDLHVGKTVTDSSTHLEKGASTSKYGDRLSIAALFLLTIGFALEAYMFARVQDVWMDESTQLTGAGLALTDLFRWLAGDHSLDPYGLPGDRMPPLSYLIDWAWFRIYGSSELGFRLLHASFAVIGALALSVFVWRNLGSLAAFVLLAFFVLSPKLIQIGVEIRAYPFFFAITCVQTVIFVRLVSDPTKADVKFLSMFVLACLTAVYTHFYGVVSSAAFILVLGIAYVRAHTALLRLMVASLVLAIGSIGILPFVLAGVNRSGQIPADAFRADRHLLYLLKLFGDPANVVSVPSAILFFGGIFALFAAGSMAMLGRLRRKLIMPLDWLLAVLIVGSSATILASFVFTSFDALSIGYSVWLFAPIGALIAVGGATQIGLPLWDNAGRFVAIGMMVLGSVHATFILLSDSSMFVHGPNRFVGALYDSAEGPKAIVYEADALWKFSYFPLVFSHRSEIVQYRAAANGDGVLRIERGDGLFGAERNPSLPAAQSIDAAVAPYKTLLIINVQLQTFRDIRQCRNSSAACGRVKTGAVESALTGGGGWREVKTERWFGLYDTQVKILEQAAVGKR